MMIIIIDDSQTTSPRVQKIELKRNYTVEAGNYLREPSF
jgi:hypothetical protein